MNPLADLLEQALNRTRWRKSSHDIEITTIDAVDPWCLSIRLTLDDTDFVFRSVTDDDVTTLQAFGQRLSPASRQTFGPYPWDDPDKLTPALTNAITDALRRSNATYILTNADVPVGHCFLWKAVENTLSQAHNVQVPELGVAVADAWHGRGLGTLMMFLLQAVATHLKADAIELTTLLDNDVAFHTYQAVGYEYLGNIPNPTHVDVTEAALGRVAATTFHAERHMVLVLNPDKRAATLDYLAQKRCLFEKLADEARSTSQESP